MTPSKIRSKICKYWNSSRWHKLLCVVLLVFGLLLSTMYGISRWYAHSVSNQPLVYGVSFIPAYAESLGVDPHETMDGLIDLGIKHFRLTSYWDRGEPAKGTYDFTELDWQFKKAEAAHAKVSLSLGLRQPRWPECHMPDWAKTEPAKQWYPELNNYIKAVVERYKDSPSLDTYQVENEYFLVGFGVCTDMNRDRLISEFNLVKSLDNKHLAIIARSNNGIGIPIGQPKPDMYGVSIYKRVWDAQITHRYFEYPIPAWFYGFLAGAQKIHDGRNMVVHELQAEAWGPNYRPLKELSLKEQKKSLDAKRLKDRFGYGKATGMRTIDLWGGEYWYYRKVVLNDPTLWNVAKEEYKNSSH